MADSDRCVLAVCHDGGVKKSFSKGGIDKILSAAKVREDRELSVQLQSLLETHGDTATIVCHHGCYCTYTSKEKIDRLKKHKNVRLMVNVSRLHGCIHGLLRVVRLNINVIAYFVVKSVYQEMVSTQTDGSVFVSVWQRIVLTKMAIHSRQWKIWSLTLQNSVTMMLQEGSNCTSHLFRIYHLPSASTMYDAITVSWKSPDMLIYPLVSQMIMLWSKSLT